MRAKAPKVVVTFATTSDALAMEACSREYGIPGRVIPVPSEIDAGCGLAWCAEESDRDALLSALSNLNLIYEGTHQVNLY